MVDLLKLSQTTAIFDCPRMSKNNRAKPKLSMMNFLYLRLLLASLLVPNTAATQSDVIIIGAGATGMSAAKTLLA